MQFAANTPAGLRDPGQEIVEIKLWEVYLLYNRQHLYTTLSAYSLDNGPVEKLQQEEGRVSFRFMLFDWQRSIKQLLYDHRIPVVIQSNSFAAVKARGSKVEELALNF